MEPTSPQIVDQVLAGYPDWKHAVRALEQLSPDTASVRLVIDALERRVCESWLAACLLGAIGRELSDALFAEIDRGGLPFTAEQERILRERLAQPSAPLPSVKAVPR